MRHSESEGASHNKGGRIRVQTNQDIVREPLKVSKGVWRCSKVFANVRDCSQGVRRCSKVFVNVCECLWVFVMFVSIHERLCTVVNLVRWSPDSLARRKAIQWFKIQAMFWVVESPTESLTWITIELAYLTATNIHYASVISDRLSNLKNISVTPARNTVVKCTYTKKWSF
jgi:hypothetical protein